MWYNQLYTSKILQLQCETLNEYEISLDEKGYEWLLHKMNTIPFSSFHICSVFTQVLTPKPPVDARTCSVVSEPAAALVNDLTTFLFSLLH